MHPNHVQQALRAGFSFEVSNFILRRDYSVCVFVCVCGRSQNTGLTAGGICSHAFLILPLILQGSVCREDAAHSQG